MFLFLDICQIRLDFDDVVLTQPSTTATSVGKCDGDNIAFTSASGTSLTSLCGTLTGTHSKAVSKTPSDYLDKMFFFSVHRNGPRKHWWNHHRLNWHRHYYFQKMENQG